VITGADSNFGGRRLSTVLKTPAAFHPEGLGPDPPRSSSSLLVGPGDSGDRKKPVAFQLPASSAAASCSQGPSGAAQAVFGLDQPPELGEETRISMALQFRWMSAVAAAAHHRGRTAKMRSGAGCAARSRRWGSRGSSAVTCPSRIGRFEASGTAFWERFSKQRPRPSPPPTDFHRGLSTAGRPAELLEGEARILVTHICRSWARRQAVAPVIVR